jgi:hypothetical protein
LLNVKLVLHIVTTGLRRVKSYLTVKKANRLSVDFLTDIILYQFCTKDTLSPFEQAVL